MFYIFEVFLKPHLYRVHSLSHILGLAFLASDQVDQIVEFASDFRGDYERPASGGTFD